MNDPVKIEIVNGKPSVTSLQIAEAFGKSHKNVLADIRVTIAKCSESFTGLNFQLSGYKDSTGRNLPMYLLTKDGLLMVKYLSEKSRVETNGTNTWRIRESKTVLQEAYEATDPKRKTAAEDHSNTLTWTNEIPNVPGFYWMRSSLFPEPHIMNFSIEVIPLCADDLLPGIEFAGPIPEPTESRRHDGK